MVYALLMNGGVQSEPYERTINGDLQALGKTDSVSNRSTVLTQLRRCSSNECTFSRTLCGMSARVMFHWQCEHTSLSHLFQSWSMAVFHC